MRAALAVAAVMAAAPTAAADNGMGTLVEGVVTTGLVLELAVPDVRLVFGAEDHRWVLSWPVVVTSVALTRARPGGSASRPSSSRSTSRLATRCGSRAASARSAYPSWA